MRMGLEEAYKDELVSWTELHAKVREWDLASKTRAISSALGRPNPSAASASSGPSASMKADPDDVNVKREVRGMVERSLRAYGILHEAMTEELRVQTAHIPPGYAYGVWSWLEKKFQSTEVDCVNDLIEKWMELRMDSEESFDNYRARVNKICVLLEQAKEKPSARIFAYKMLDMLQPRYRPAVLALKAGDKLKDPCNVNWEDVAAFLNSHERSEHRMGMMDLDGGVGSTMAMSAKYRQKSGNKNVQCFNCGEMGHISRFCENPRRDSTERSEERHDTEERSVRKGPSGRAREDQASMVYARPHDDDAPYLGGGYNVAYGVRTWLPDGPGDSNRLSCESRVTASKSCCQVVDGTSCGASCGQFPDHGTSCGFPEESCGLTCGRDAKLWNMTF